MNTDLITWSQKLALELSNVGWQMAEDRSVWHDLGRIAAILRREALPASAGIRPGIDLTKQTFRQSRGSIDSHVVNLSGLCDHDFGGLLGGRCRKCGLTHPETVFGPRDAEPSIEQIKEITNRILKDARKETPMSTTRCKFRLESVTRDMNGSRVIRDAEGKPVKDERGYEKRMPCERRTLKFSPVYGNGNPDHENTKFWEASPSGSFELSCVNLKAVEHMEPGHEYYIDISPAAS